MHKVLLLFLFVFLPLLNFGQEVKEAQIYTFGEVEQPPLSRTCKRKKTVEQQRECTVSYVADYVNRRFDTRMAAKVMEGDPVQLEAKMIITKEGTIGEVKASGGPEELNSHLEEILLGLKSFRPALQDGKPVDVVYTAEVSMQFRQKS